MEPDDLQEIWSECHPDRFSEPLGQLTGDKLSAQVEAAFLARVCGCILGKPLEFKINLYQIREILEEVDAWPLTGYLPKTFVGAVNKVLPKRRPHFSWTETVKEQIRYVAPDDDINYTVLGMLVLEQYGMNFTTQNVRSVWLEQLPAGLTFGPEARALAGAALERSTGTPPEPDRWTSLFNTNDVHCGALIRVDPYAYAAAGNPALAAELAWRDASFTHRKTGVYSSMFVAAAIATAFVAKSPIEIFETALYFVPQRSRFYKVASLCLEIVKNSQDWLEAYDEIYNKYKTYGHCQVYQEIGLLMNAVIFADNVGDGLCKQVSQGADTDCFGATAGSILGAYFGPDSLGTEWLQPFNNTIRVALAQFFEQDLKILTERIGGLSNIICT